MNANGWRLGVLMGVLALGASGGTWYRGNLHAHSLWSDGDAFPEDAVAWYRDNGYHFLCLSDHQLVQTDPAMWVEVGSKKLGRVQADRYVSGHPASAELKKEGARESVRLKTIWELKKTFDQPETFLLLPGQECSDTVIGGLQVHMNAINVSATLPYRYGVSPSETCLRLSEAVRVWGDERAMPTVSMMNHPAWPYFDIPPEVLIGLPQIRLFEVCNASGGPSFTPTRGWYTMENYWDIVNAFRIEDGYAAVFGTATDDTHFYFDPKRGARPGEAWICVQAARLEADALIQALYRGDFYASTGVALQDVAFDGETGTLRVRVEPEADVRYTIRFVTTKSGFDRKTEAFDDPARDKKPARRGVRYSDDIGKTVQETSGTEASYTLSPDDLYVRAVVVSSKRAVNRENGEPDFATAWTQPCGWRLWQVGNPVKARLARPK